MKGAERTNESPGVANTLERNVLLQRDCSIAQQSGEESRTRGAAGIMGNMNLKSVYSVLKNAALRYLPDSLLKPLKAWHYERVIRSFTDEEEPDLAVVRKLVEPGSVAIDLGANIGMYTKALSELVGREGTVISVEPIAETFDLLKRNVRSLGLSNVECLNLAVSDARGQAVMEVPRTSEGNTNFYQAHLVADANASSAGSQRRVRVSTDTLDALSERYSRVGFVKCDVEGNEHACLLGAQRLLSSHFPAWLVEISGDPDQSVSIARNTFGLFEEHAYTPWWFDGVRLKQRRQGDKSTNYFFLRPQHVSRLRTIAPGLFS